MANHHFGNFGDLWKHLPLAEVLALGHPNRHWETHAGSALYAMTPARGRDHGILWYLSHLEQRHLLRDSMYARLTWPLFKEALQRRTAPIVPDSDGDASDTTAPGCDQGGPSSSEALRCPGVERGGIPFSTFPGSPFIALAALGNQPQQYMFCDLDDVSLGSIRTAARHLNIDRDRLRVVRTDGIAMVADALERLSPEDAANTFIFIDPFRPEIASATLGISAFDLFVRAARRGCQTMLWYGYHHEDAVAASKPPATRLVSRSMRHDEIRRTLAESRIAASDHADAAPPA
ncbi:MAG: hypothetical protein ACOC0P_07675 [Planctomycetota bacterium]